jgi:hypothetical protein
VDRTNFDKHVIASTVPSKIRTFSMTLEQFIADLDELVEAVPST